MRFRQFILLVFVFSLIIATSHRVSADDETIQLYLNNKQLQTEITPMIIEGNTLVPVRLIAEEIGANVVWSADNRKVTISQNAKQIELKIDDKIAQVNQLPIKMNVAPLIVKGNTLLPLRFIGEQLGIKFIYDQFTHAIYMFKPANGLVVTPLISSENNQILDSSNVPLDEQDSKSDPSTSSSENIENAVIYSIDTSDQGLIVKARSGVLKPKTMRLSNPNRLVFEFPNAILDANLRSTLISGIGEIKSSHPFVQKISYSSAFSDPLSVRVTLDLTQLASYEVMPTDESYVFQVFLTKYYFKIVIDPGHGGKDTGAISYTGKYEKNFNLTIAKKISQLLAKDERIKVTLTRTKDVFIGLDERVNLANEMGADLFVSIHGNQYVKSSTKGVETYFTRDDSRQLALILHRAVLQSTGFLDRDVRRDYFRVTRNTTMPAVLLELGYLSNRTDEATLFRNSIQDKIASNLSKAIIKFIDTYEVKSPSL
jgi:N-acetylmuramoyl-L-alanine amidase